eukprot:Em0015g912a
MPRVDELLDQPGNRQYMTTLDLARGYWQVPVIESASSLEGQHKITFTTPYGLYHFKTWVEHIYHLRGILTRLRAAKLMARPEKCQLRMRHWTSLGHVVGCGRVRSEQNKIEAVKSFPIPLTKKDMSSFLGLTGYYQKFIANYTPSDSYAECSSNTDASGEEHPVAYYSWKLAQREKNYATIEKECLSIRAAIQNFRVYLVGSTFTVVTDHKAFK